jgi:hypothetical protein
LLQLPEGAGIDGKIILMADTLELTTGEPDSTKEHGVVGGDIVAIAERGRAVAEAIAATEPFNHLCAEMSLRALAALFNGGPDAINGSTLARLGEAGRDRLKTLAIASYDFLGEHTKADAQRELEAHNPRSDTEAEVVMMRHSFNALQLAVSNGGYNSDQEDDLRGLVIQYADAFASTYQGLHSLEHPLATDPNRVRYFATTIEAAAPPSMHSAASSQDHADHV